MGKPKPKKDENKVLKLIEGKGKKEINYKDFIELSTIDFSSCERNIDRIKVLRDCLQESIPIAEGLFRNKPTRPHSQILTNFIHTYKDLQIRIDNLEAISPEEIAERINSEIIDPLTQEMIIALGAIIKRAIKQSDLNPAKKKQLKTILNDIFTSFGSSVEEKVKSVQGMLVEILS